jgi:hypothetical protein
MALASHHPSAVAEKSLLEQTLLVFLVFLILITATAGFFTSSSASARSLDLPTFFCHSIQGDVACHVSLCCCAQWQGKSPCDHS